MKKYTFLILFATSISLFGISQPAQNYTTANAHSHNDYQKPFPFHEAYNAGFGSIEMDIFLENEKLYIAHDVKELSLKNSVENLYLKPIDSVLKINHNSPYSNPDKKLQILVDIKTDAQSTLAAFINVLKKYPSLIHAPNLKWVISGNQPNENSWKEYPDFILFDGDFNKKYTQEQLLKVGLFSASLSDFTRWNGKSNIPSSDLKKIKSAIEKAKSFHVKTRFWASPDFVNAWYQLMDAGVDYLNTDKIYELKHFLENFPRNTYFNQDFYEPYTPTYKNDSQNKPVKNVILFIGDGCGLAQLYAGYTANKGKLNIFNMQQTGLSKTNSYDAYITDSAPGSTAFSSGHKTCNRFVGVDHNGIALKLLPDYLIKKKIKTGVITTGDVTDATPADFYAHNISRDNATEIYQDLAKSNINILAGSGNNAYNDTIKSLLEQNNFSITNNLINVKDKNKKWLVMQPQAGLSILHGRKDWLQKSFDTTLNYLRNDNGFFMVVEGAQIDYGGHANDLPYVTTEVLDFDKTIGEAMRFADQNGETLIIVVADHETGGLTLLDGNIDTGYVSGHFSTNDHTAVPISVFAYGPHSEKFSGFYENTEIFKKILEVFGVDEKNR